MYSLELLIATGIAALIIGAVIGAAIAQRSGASQRTQRQLETQLEDMKQQAESYQHEVTEHFNETAELLNQLTSSYRDVHTHLAKGAQTLVGEGKTRQTIKQLGADSEQADKSDDSVTTPLTPPLDYAPRSTAADPGMLNEEFGLDKTTELHKQDKKTAAGD